MARSPRRGSSRAEPARGAADGPVVVPMRVMNGGAGDVEELDGTGDPAGVAGAPGVPGPALDSGPRPGQGGLTTVSGDLGSSLARPGTQSRNTGGPVTQGSLTRHSVGPIEVREDQQKTSSASAAPPLDDITVEAAKRGDPSSWEAAYLAYGRALMGYLMVRLDNRDDASEALSETFVRAISKASSFRGDAFAFRAWLFTIARHVSTDQHRRRARLVVVPDQPDTEDGAQPSSEDVAIRNEDVIEMRKGFARLSPADREVLWLRVCSGLSAADVGEILGKRAGAVRMQQMRALESLRGQVRL